MDNQKICDNTHNDMPKQLTWFLCISIITHYYSRNSSGGVATRLRAAQLRNRVRFPADSKDFFFLESSKPIQWIPVAASLKVKRQRREALRPITSASCRGEEWWSYSPLPHTCRQLTKLGDNFALQDVITVRCGVGFNGKARRNRLLEENYT
jgi:hypothetical protein